MDPKTNNFLLLFEGHLRDRKLFKRRQKILIACSGGPDSVALFSLLRQLAPKYAWRLGLAHFNHKLRPGAAVRDERFVRDLARKFKVAFYGGRGDVKWEARRRNASIEECARQMRYDFFLRIARKKKFHAVALAHTKDDQAETVLMRVLQGTGLRGLQGIRERFKMGCMTCVRPLLSFTKKELLEYLATQRIPFRSDRSNESSRFVRNRIRLQLIPGLQRDFNPRVVEALSRIPAIVAEESALIAEIEAKAWKKSFKKCQKGKVELRRPIFLKLPPALQFRMIEKSLKRLDDQSGLSFEAWERIRRGLGRSYHRLSLPKDIDFMLTSKNVMVYKK
jgi:tRNA(Ile)-lysidine synthase